MNRFSLYPHGSFHHTAGELDLGLPDPPVRTNNYQWFSEWVPMVDNPALTRWRAERSAQLAALTGEADRLWRDYGRDPELRRLMRVEWNGLFGNPGIVSDLPVTHPARRP